MKRFDLEYKNEDCDEMHMVESSNGDYVMRSDHEAELAKVTAELAELKSNPSKSLARRVSIEMQGEIERLREIVAGLRKQHGRDSAELRSLCAARDKARAERDAYRDSVNIMERERDKLIDETEKAEAERDHFADAGKMVEEENAKLRKQVSNPQFSGIQCLADIREAVGDPTGKLMQDELVALVRKIVADRDTLRKRIAVAPIVSTEINDGWGLLEVARRVGPSVALVKLGDGE